MFVIYTSIVLVMSIYKNVMHMHADVHTYMIHISECHVSCTIQNTETIKL